jgi:hypothetical protein
MKGILLGAAMLVSSPAASPTVEPPRAAVSHPTLTFELRNPTVVELPGDESRSFARRHAERWRRSAQTAKPKHSRVDRIIAVAAGASIGWVVGGAIGYAVTPKRGPDDDTSGLKGVLIGAPIGAVAGALIGYRLTKP